MQDDEEDHEGTEIVESGDTLRRGGVRQRDGTRIERENGGFHEALTPAGGEPPYNAGFRKSVARPLNGHIQGHWSLRTDLALASERKIMAKQCERVVLDLEANPEIDRSFE
jgi:hypothetical protein